MAKAITAFMDAKGGLHQTEEAADAADRQAQRVEDWRKFLRGLSAYGQIELSDLLTEENMEKARVILASRRRTKPGVELPEATERPSILHPDIDNLESEG